MLLSAQYSGDEGLPGLISESWDRWAKDTGQARAGAEESFVPKDRNERKIFGTHSFKCNLSKQQANLFWI